MHYVWAQLQSEGARRLALDQALMAMMHYAGAWQQPAGVRMLALGQALMVMTMMWGHPKVHHIPATAPMPSKRGRSKFPASKPMPSEKEDAPPGYQADASRKGRSTS